MDDPVKQARYESSSMAFNKELEMNTQAQKMALITGGSRGLGRNTAESLARNKRSRRLV
jgi:hypothetical protein